MPETLPRPLIALTVIVAALAIYTGVKDHYDQKRQAVSAANTVSATDASAAQKLPAKKKHLRKAAEARRRSAPAGDSGATQNPGADIAQQLVHDQFAQASAHAKLGVGNDQDAGANAESEKAGEIRNRKQQGSREFDASLSPECLPLPNMTKPGDVDAPYYENWAKEYCGR
jgi:hypothetical protein